MEVNLGPQPGPQTQFLSTEADIAIYGGAAGGGKSYGLLLEPLRHYENSKFGAVIFRRTTPQIRSEGSLWDTAVDAYSPLQPNPKQTTLEMIFQTGMKVSFAHLEYDKTVFDYQGAQIPLMGFDELTHFSEYQFFYMLSRNRSTSGVPGYVRATCNPDPDSWVRDFIDWWIDEDGFPIPERAGVLRWFIRIDGEIHWADSREELIQEFGVTEMPKSVTFIPALLTDNKILMEKDPSYLANLKALPKVEQARFLGGNWNVRFQPGDYFQRQDFNIAEQAPVRFKKIVRYWDRAASEPTPENPNPDWTVGVKMGVDYEDRYWVLDVERARKKPGGVKTLIKATADIDGFEVRCQLEEDPGQAGKAEIDDFRKFMAGYNVGSTRVSKDKETRAKPFSSQVQLGGVYLVRAPWNNTFISELEAFPSAKAKKDQVDAASGAFNHLSNSGVGEFTKEMTQTKPRTGEMASIMKQEW